MVLTGEIKLEWVRRDSNRREINLQNTQTAHAAQYERNKQPNEKMSRRPK